MTDRHCHALPPPPPNLPRRMLTAAAVPTGDPPHFWRGDPVTWHRLPKPKRVRARNGKTLPARYEVRWYLDRVAGTTRPTAVKRLYDVLLNPDGWLRAGVHWRRVARRADADLLVRVIPADQTVCGPGSAGCFSFGFEPDGKPCAENGVEYLDNDPVWQVVVGMEVCAHPLSAEDMYDARHQPYLGVLGTWQAAARVGYVPTREEVACVRQFLDGTIDPRLVHH